MKIILDIDLEITFYSFELIFLPQRILEKKTELYNVQFWDIVVQCTVLRYSCTVYSFEEGLYSVYVWERVSKSTGLRLSCTVYSFEIWLYNVQIWDWVVHCTGLRKGCTMYIYVWEIAV